MDDPFTRPALVRRETLKRLEAREERYTEWFQPQDASLKVAGTSCTQVRDIFFSKLSRKEKESALKDADAEALEKSMAEIQSRYLDKKDRWYSSDKAKTVVEGFMAFGEVFTKVIEKVLKSAPPEYGAAFGVLNFIYKGIKEKSDREEKLSGYLKKMAPVIAQKDFYRQAINTPKMRDAFQAFCTGIVKFVIAADKYCTKMSIVKLILSSTISDPLQQYYDDVNKCVDVIENLRMAASLALLLEQRSKTEEIAQVLVKMYEKATAPSATPESTAILSLVNYKATSRAQKLTSCFNLPSFDAQLEKSFNDAQRIYLAPRDQWEYHPSQIQFPSWEVLSPRPLLWLSGPERASGISWVSSFSVDLIDALSASSNFVSAYIFCSNENDDFVLTPLAILQRLITSILESFPQITISHISTLSLRRFQQVHNSGFKAWDLLVEILEIVQDVMVEKAQELYIIIDRLDLAMSDETFGVQKQLIPRLQEISQRWRNTRVVVTSTVMADRVGTLRDEDGWLKNVWLDTERAVGMDDTGAYDDWD